MERYKCKNCKYEFNVSLGTFGGGMPKKCPQCSYFREQFEKIADEWRLSDGRWMSEVKP